jgi:lipopolysaccharide cholinephosphotransferase
MKEIQIEELRELQMQILDYVDVFCRKHDIKYTISGGTLLGAVRHGGYIPWDDDMDIQMLRNDYNKFTILWNKNKSEHPYELLNIESGKNMGYPFGKVHNPKTITVIDGLERTGVYIDVFPIDEVLDEEDFRTRHIKVLNYYKQRALVFLKMKKKNGILSWKQRLLLLIHPEPTKTFNEIADEINSIAKLYSDKPQKWVFEMVAGTQCKLPIPRNVFEHFSDIKFEKRVYMSVEDYDQYLTLTFGDYMKPPAKKDRHVHLFHAYWK